MAPVEIVADEEDGEDNEKEWEDLPAAEEGNGEAEDGECRDGEAAGENLGEQDAGGRAEEDAQAGFARLGWHGFFLTAD